MLRRFEMFSLIRPLLLAVMGVQAMQPFHLPEGSALSGSADLMRRASPGAPTALSGPTVSQLQRAFPRGNLIQVGPAGFRALFAVHSGRGLLLAGPALAAAAMAADIGSPPETPLEAVIGRALDARTENGAVEGSGPAAGEDSPIASDPSSDPASDTVLAGPRALREYQAKQAAGRDSLRCDSLWRLGDDQDYGADETHVEDARARAYLGNLLVDVSNSGPGELDEDGPWAAILFVVIGVTVVGAFVFYGAHTLYELAVNKADYPVFVEAGARFSHSGKAWRDGDGADLYRNANLAGIRFAIGLDRPGVGLGLSAEGGYIDVALRGLDDPSRTFGFNGAYFLAGPMLRFGRNDPYSFSLEFLNGASDHASIGWISKSRMTLARKFGSHILLGAHLGAVFYELEFLDGLAWRRGSINRDLSMVYGLDTGWDF